MSIPKIESYEMPIIPEIENQVNWTLQPEKAVLLIHDMQQYFLDYYDQQQSPIPELISNIKKLKKKCESLNIPIIYTAQPGNQRAEDRALLTDFWGTGLENREEQTAIISQLSPNDKDIVLTKWRYSAFKKSDLQQLMSSWNRNQLIICGVYAHIGCMLTATDAFMYDIKPFLVADGVADFSAEDHKMAIRYASKKCSFITTTAQLTDELQQILDISNQDSGISIRNFVIEKAAYLLDEEPSQLSITDDLVDKGMDSIRMMNLIEELRQQGINISFLEMAERPILGDLLSFIETKQELFA